MRKKIAKIAGAIILAGAIALTSAGAARADVLVNYDGGSIHLGQSMQLGVWYQSFSGGPGNYWEGRHEHGDAAPRQVLKDAPHGLAAGQVEPGGGLVQEDHGAPSLAVMGLLSPRSVPAAR